MMGFVDLYTFTPEGERVAWIGVVASGTGVLVGKRHEARGRVENARGVDQSSDVLLVATHRQPMRNECWVRNQQMTRANVGSRSKPYRAGEVDSSRRVAYLPKQTGIHRTVQVELHVPVGASERKLDGKKRRYTAARPQEYC
ncbi:phospholipid-transporting ATPase [Pseudozyma hubeiensis SY62]|uniref:Phospholipid-transporting ATPase n=1 Tax=Pseudozyma hubeiensis (strain SY62) TaxID=1305764 RepID=R9NZJ6_PSEHS|nr:phospholipid-transporting ATPase [Pseudozyma hubeiensis SY62]GAC94206.1 phospholipid-transporting ATPase [Pseudozyma hubeiensis SY62]